MKIMLAQTNPIVGDLTGNAAVIARRIGEARVQGADLVVFPELALVGYPPRDLLLRSDFQAACARVLHEVVAPATADIAAVVGGVRLGGRALLHNTAFWLQDGAVRGWHDKILLPNYDVFDEVRYFAPGEACASFELKGKRIGLTVCEDCWNDPSYWGEHTRYDRNPPAELAAGRPDLVINISASPYYLGKYTARREMLQALTRRYGFGLVYCNQVGANDDLIFDGASFVLGPDGAVAAQLPPFTEAAALWDSEAPAAAAALQEDVAWAHDGLVLGLRDYMHKQGFRKAVIGLSGGIDSSVAAVLAVAALGRENVLGVSMPSRFSSAHSRDDARDLAANLGMEYRVIPIEPAHVVMQEMLQPAGLAAENLQARLRGVILWTIANQEGRIVLGTGNKSESAVGYCTMGADALAGIGLLGDIPKLLVYDLARFINRQREIIPAGVLTKAPSAELRPNQKDSDSLGEYETLDDILFGPEGYVDGNKSVDEIVARGHDRETVRRLARMCDLAEYKRRQMAPNLKMTSRNFSNGRRYPIVQGFVRQL